MQNTKSKKLICVTIKSTDEKTKDILFETLGKRYINIYRIKTTKK